MRVFVDTNVVLDVLARREPFYTDSRCVLDWCRGENRYGLLSALTYANIAYVMRKYAGFERMLESVRNLHQLFETSPMTDGSVASAIESGNADFEDAMQYASAMSAGADVIVTRDPSGFVGAKIRVMSPTEFLESVKSVANNFKRK